MCEKKPCLKGKKDLCSCEALKSECIAVFLIHVAENMQNVEWEFDYTTLSYPESRRLCAVGNCRRCGGRLCNSIELDDTASGDDLLAIAYSRLLQYTQAGPSRMASKPFREMFVDMFHAQDREFVREWLDRPENQSLETMSRK